jgi:hypothetical protein
LATLVQQQDESVALSLLRVISFLLLLLFISGSGSVRAAEIDWFITNTTDVDGRPIRTDASVFNCSDQIYTMVSFSDLRETTHTLIVDWIDPSGRQREHTVHNFRYFGNPASIWAWLTLHPPRGAIALRLFDPSVGMREFIGAWTVRITIDYQFLGRAKFEVLC